MDRLHTRPAFCTAVLLLVNLPSAYWAFPAHGQTQSTPEKLRSYHLIEQAMLAGEIDAARRQLSKIIEANPKDGRAWLLLGNLYEKRGDLDQAVVAYRQASYLNEPDATTALRAINTRLGVILKQAEQAFAESSLLRATESDSDAKIRRLQRYSGMGDFTYPNGELIKGPLPCDWTREMVLPRSLGKGICSPRDEHF